METTVTINVYEINGEDVTDKKMGVKSHWNRDDFVDIKINGKIYTVLALELKKAIDNATNN